MIKTKIKKALAIIALWALATTNFGSTFAAPIGTGSVTGDSGFDAAIIWDDTFPGTATGTVTGIVVTADVAPTLNMTISTGAISLGTLTSASYSTGSLNIEIGTNAVDGVSITARSQSGWLTHTTDNSMIINNTASDWVVDNYTFSSATWAVDDSDFADFNVTATLWVTEVVDNTSEHTIYSTDRPEQDSGSDDVIFYVSAKPNAQTAAWNYQDKINLTVVGNF